MSYCCENPQTTHLALWRAREPSELYLCLKIRLPETTLAPGGRGTRRQVPLSISALYSSSIAARQLGSARALRQLAGSGETWTAEYVRRSAGPGREPVCALVTTRRGGSGGGRATTARGEDWRA